MVFEKERPEQNFCRIEWEGGDVLGALFPSFQSGVWVVVPAGIPIGTLLGERGGLSREFIEKTVVRVQVKLFNRLIEGLERVVLGTGSFWKRIRRFNVWQLAQDL